MFTQKKLNTLHCAGVEELKAHEVEISFTYGNNTFLPGEILGACRPNELVTMTVSVKHRRNLAPVVAHVHQDKTGATDTTIHSPLRNDGVNDLYTILFSISPQGTPVWPGNRDYILIEAPGGGYQLFLCGIFAQNGRTVGWIELADEGKIIRDEVGVKVFTNSNLWRELIMSLASGGHYERRALKDEDDTESPSPMGANLLSGQGQVKWFNPFMGVGYADFLSPESGNIISAKIHYSSLPVQAGLLGFRKVEAGQLIWANLENGTHTKGPKTGQQHLELKNIRLCRS